MVMRGAPRAETHGRAPARRAPPLQGGYVWGAPRRSHGTVAAQSSVPNAASPTFREVRGALEHR